MIDVRAEDKPFEQFTGPITVALILVKYRQDLQQALGANAPNSIHSPQNLMNGLFDLLYNPAKAQVRTQLINSLNAIDVNAGTALDTGFQKADGLTSQQKLRSIEYVNHTLSLDLRFFRSLSRKIPANALNNIYVECLLRDGQFRVVMENSPLIPRPQAAYLVNTLGLFPNEAALNQFVRQNQPFYGAYANYQQAYYYPTTPEAKQQLLLQEYIGQQLSTTGLECRPGRCMIFSGPQQFNQSQWTRLLGHLRSEAVDTAQLQRPISEWQTLTVPESNRSLAAQVGSSISECAKSDKGIKSLVKYK